MDNIKTVEFKTYYEELLIANIIKEKIIEKTSAEQVFKKLCVDERQIINAKNTVKNVIGRHYAGDSFYRKCAYRVNYKRIEDKFFNKLLQIIEKDIDNMERPELKKENECKIDMVENIRIIIADDNIGFCNIINEYLKKIDNIEVLAIVHNDEDEISQIERLKPDIVVTDLVRNRKYTGLDIIKDYQKRKNAPQFLIISADRREDIIDNSIEIGGYIQKPFYNYDLIAEELFRIKTEILNKQNELDIKEQIQKMEYDFLHKFIEILKTRK